MADDPLAQIDAELEEVLIRIADSGFAGQVDEAALAKYAQLTEQRLRLTEPALELAA